MSAQKPMALSSTRPGPRILLAVVSVLLLSACLVALVRDSSRRRAATDAAVEQGLDRRQPAVLATTAVLEDGDDAVSIVAEALLDERDAAGTPPSADRAGEVQGLLLETIARRPGSAQSRLLLGRSAPLGGSPRLWVKPLELAAGAAPGLDTPATELGRRYLTAWPNLPPEDRARGEAAVGRAFRNPAFVRSFCIVAVDAMGAEAAVRSLPNDPATLREASLILAGHADPSAAALLKARLEALGPAARPAPAASRPVP